MESVSEPREKFCGVRRKPGPREDRWADRKHWQPLQRRERLAVSRKEKAAVSDGKIREGKEHGSTTERSSGCFRRLKRCRGRRHTRSGFRDPC